ncbi:outer membrane protein assembly factor BamD [Candidatus Pelagibacter bacterium]|nr:outer membrane protein assembly factor BamD [Candidatus Pelagibacter bacterium]MDA8841737.1 outer membrane protein assembly factor BamD [Candidatus Pelagibacter bacterium]
MNFFFKLIIILAILILNACSKNEKEISLIKEINQEDEMIQAYKEGVKALEENDTFFAAKKFLEAELLFPQSDWAPKSSLMASYAYYLEGNYFNAIYNLERFLKTYPKDPRLDYVYYLMGLSYYENIEGEKKDLKPLLEAKKKFEFIIENYPNTDFALDSKFKIGLINDILASKEMYLGRHYIKKEKWVAAINRFKTILNDYDTTIYTEEAIHRLVEIHYKIGLEGEAKKYASLLGYNYLSSEWYEKTYNIFNKEYELKSIKNSNEMTLEKKST